MPVSRNKLYAILILACTAGYGWIFYSMMVSLSGSDGVEVCPIKHITKLPCPSCGSTRSVLALLQGDFLKALYMNPFGVIIAVILLTIPIWIVIDILTGKESLWIFYRRIEMLLKKPAVALPVVLLVVINWIWNIAKQL